MATWHPNSDYSRSRLNTHSALPACHPLYVIRVELTQCTVSNENKQTNKQTLARSQKNYVVSSIYEHHSPWTETVLECILFSAYWFLLPRPIAYLKNNTLFTVWYHAWPILQMTSPYEYMTSTKIGGREGGRKEETKREEERKRRNNTKLRLEMRLKCPRNWNHEMFCLGWGAQTNCLYL